MNVSVKTIPKRYLVKLIYIILILAIFDDVRNYLFISEYISPLKEIFIFVIFFNCICYYNIKSINKFILFLVLPLIIYLIILTPLIIITYNYGIYGDQTIRPNPLALHYKVIEFFLLFILFDIIISKMDYNSIIQLIKFFIKLTIIFILFNIIAYFISFPFFTIYRPYYGRITTGYPTADGEFMCLALLCNMYMPLWRKKIVFFIINIVLLIGIIMQTTAVGFVSLFIILFYYLVIGHRKDINKQINIITFIIGGGIIFLFIFFIYVYYYDTLNVVFNMAIKKINFSFSYFNLNSNDTMDITDDTSVLLRQDHFANSMKVYNDLFYLIFGAGTSLGGYIENSFQFFLRAYGYLGLGLYIVFILGLLFHALFINKDKILKNIEFCSIAVLVITSKALILPYIFAIAMPLSLVFMVCFNKSMIHEHV